MGYKPKIITGKVTGTGWPIDGHVLYFSQWDYDNYDSWHLYGWNDGVLGMYGRRFPCLDKGFAPGEAVDVVIRPEDIDIVSPDQGQLTGTVTEVTFKGVHYDTIVDFRGFKWLIQTTDYSPVGARIGVKIDPDGFHIMKKSAYSGQFGDYSSYSAEYDELNEGPGKAEDGDEE